MSVEIREIPKTKKALKRYVNFGIDHYKGNDCFVPPLVFDEVATLRPEGNPAFEFVRLSHLWHIATVNP